MSETIRPAVTQGHRRRGDTQWQHARVCLASGRHAEAIGALRTARRHRPAADHPSLALSEADALLGLQRGEEAVRVATRALAGRHAQGDVASRLRIVRGRGMWLCGRVHPARREVTAAAALASHPLTQARAEEALGSFAWKEQDHAAANRHLDAAHALFVGCGFSVGLVAALGHQAGVLRDAGRLDQALSVHDRRVLLADGLPRLDLRAQARADRGSALAALGRWPEAAAEIALAQDGFGAIGDERALTVAAATGVVVDLATGEFIRARDVLSRLRDSHLRAGRSRMLAEALLLTSDLELACGAAGVADALAAEALGLFSRLRDAEGACRSRVRRVHALLELGRTADALGESRRALRDAGGIRGDLRALCLLASGRAMLWSGATGAATTFAAARALAGCRAGFAAAAALGEALSTPHPPAPEAVHASVHALRAWGDRRVLSYGLSDIRRLAPAAVSDMVAAETAAAPALTATVGAPAAPAPARPAAARRTADTIVEAVSALAAAREPAAGWLRALCALESALPWARAVVVRGDTNFGLQPGAESPAELRGNDLGAAVARGSAGPAVVDLHLPPWRDHPDRALFDLRWVLAVPMGDETLVVLLREASREEAEAGLALLQAVRGLAPPRTWRHTASREAAGDHAIVGRCPQLGAMIERLNRVAPTALSVHILGETGTGKELVARAVHDRSSRRQGPFVAVNASSLREELFESEMFGHVKGAFTGAVADRAGYAAEAEGGTLFIDEVTDLSRTAQAKLLRFLQEREYRRLGEPRLRKADVRIVTAANRPLEGEGGLRPDLVFRVREALLFAPPLRERGQDVLVLARHFLAAEAARQGRPAPDLRRDAIEVLLADRWPGNVRELQSEMRLALALTDGGPIGPEHLFTTRPAPREPSGAPRCLRAAVRLFERDYVSRVLAERGGNRTLTARALGISRQTLVAKVAGLGV